MRRGALTLAASICLAAAIAPAARADAALPGPLAEVGFDQRLGERLPLDLAFRDEAGRAVRLGDFFGERPVVLTFLYYECPMLCGLVQSGLASSLKVLDFDAGKEFDVVAVSIDPGETPELAAAAQREALRRYGRPETAGGWHFLTGDEASIRRLTAAAGFRYAYLPERDEYAHSAGIIVATPDGRLARYLYGVEYPPRDLRLGLVEAADEKIGSVVDQLLLYCFHYDPVIGRYSAMTMNILRLGAVLTVLGLGLMIVLLRRREHHHPGTA